MKYSILYFQPFPHAKSFLFSTICFPCSGRLRYLLYFAAFGTEHHYMAGSIHTVYTHTHILIVFYFFVFTIFCPVCLSCIIFKKYKTFSVFIYSYINTSGNWKKREIVWKHDARRAECFHTISSFSNLHEC